jgi:lipid-A-disaccharide synthase
MLAEYTDVPVTLVSGQSQLCMAASDVVLMASGTTTLEAMLLKRPMVVAYKMARLSYAIISRLLKVPYVALPNLLANERLVPEFLQDDASVENLAVSVVNWLDDRNLVEQLKQKFAVLHRDIQRDADQRAAEAVLSLVQS